MKKERKVEADKIAQKDEGDILLGDQELPVSKNFLCRRNYAL